MRKKTWPINFLLTVLFFSITTTSAWALQRDSQDNGTPCNGISHGNGLASHREVKEQLIPSVGGTLTIDGNQNGGIAVKGADRKLSFL